MNDFKFTKALLKQTSATTPSNLHSMTDIARIERIHDNMAGINPITKELMNKPPISNNEKPNIEQNNQLREQMSSLRQIKTTND